MAWANCPGCRMCWRSPGAPCTRALHLRRWPRVGAAARVAIRAEPQLLCQRCMQGFAFPVSGGSEVEFTRRRGSGASDTERELFLIDGGMVSLRELAEEELLLALPIVPACSAPQNCGHAPSFAADAEESETIGRDATAVQRFAGFVEENLIGHSTHGSSKKQKDPVEARHASIPFRPCDHPRCRSTRRAAKPIHVIASRAKDTIAAARCFRPRRTRQRPKNKLQRSCRRLARRSPAILTHTRVGAAPYCHRRHERRLRALGLRAGGPGRGARVSRRAIHLDRPAIGSGAPVGAVRGGGSGAARSPPTSIACSPPKSLR